MNQFKIALCAATLLMNTDLRATESESHVNKQVDARGTLTDSIKTESNFARIPHDVLGEISSASNNTHQVNKSMRSGSLANAASGYAQALKAGKRVPEAVMKVLRTARSDLPFNETGIEQSSERDRVKQLIIDEIRDIKNHDLIHLPSSIPSFLNGSVTDKTSDVHDMISVMNLNPHIAEHMKHSVGYYYEDREGINKWDQYAAGNIQSMLDAMAKKYKLLDDAVQEDADLTDVEFIVTPDVGATDEAITSRTEELDTLFAANPHLTLVVAFADDVTTVGDSFGPGNFSRSVKKMSFTGKNLHTVGDNFFPYTISLVSVDFRGLGALQKVGADFLFMTPMLTHIDVLDDLPGALIMSAYNGKAEIIIKPKESIQSAHTAVEPAQKTAAKTVG